jgi:GNAT superfamily N-acetyltransferase
MNSAKDSLRFLPLSSDHEPEVTALLSDLVARERFGGLLPVKRWLDFVVGSENQSAWLAHDEENVVGLVVCELADDGTVCPAILVAANRRRQGYGARLLYFALRYAYPRTVTVEIETDNLPAIRMATCAGLQPEMRKATEGFLRMILKSGLG